MCFEVGLEGVVVELEGVEEVSAWMDGRERRRGVRERSFMVYLVLCEIVV